MDEDELEFERALEEFQARHEQARKAIRAIEDPDERYHAAENLVATVQGLVPEIARERQAAAVRIQKEGNLSIAEVGRLIGVSRARAHQMIREYQGEWKSPAERALLPPPPPPVPSLPEMEIGEADLATAHYRLYDAAGIFLYTGVADNLKERFDAHRREKPWWPEVARRTVTWYGSRRDALRAEDIAIKTEHPIHNVVGVVRDAGISERLAG